MGNATIVAIAIAIRANDIISDFTENACAGTPQTDFPSAFYGYRRFEGISL
jgi:hypothetical protein